MSDSKFKKIVDKLHNKDLINKHDLNTQASEAYYEKRSVSDKFSLSIGTVGIASGFSLIMLNENSEIGKNIGNIFRTGVNKLNDICSGTPILENLINNLQEPSISGAVLFAIGLTGIAKYVIELKYDDVLREKHNKSFIDKKVEEITGKSITSFIETKKEPVVINPIHNITKSRHKS